MRKDMDRVVITRPRSGSSNKNADVIHERQVSRNLLKDLVEHEVGDGETEWDFQTKAPRAKRGARMKGYDRKELSDFLAPLQRWLEKQIGRKWNDVYSEACKTLPRKSYLNEHVFDHLMQWVELNPVIKDKKIYESSGRYELGMWRQYFYVDSKGILRKVHRPKSKNSVKSNAPVIWIDDYTLAAQHDNGDWFAISPCGTLGPYEEYPLHSFGELKKVFHSPYRYHYGRRIVYLLESKKINIMVSGFQFKNPIHVHVLSLRRAS